MLVKMVTTLEPIGDVLPVDQQTTNRFIRYFDNIFSKEGFQETIKDFMRMTYVETIFNEYNYLEKSMMITDDNQSETVSIKPTVGNDSNNILELWKKQTTLLLQEHLRDTKMTIDNYEKNNRNSNDNMSRHLMEMVMTSINSSNQESIKMFKECLDQHMDQTKMLILDINNNSRSEIKEWIRQIFDKNEQQLKLVEQGINEVASLINSSREINYNSGIKVDGTPISYEENESNYTPVATSHVTNNRNNNPNRILKHDLTKSPRRPATLTGSQWEECSNVLNPLQMEWLERNQRTSHNSLYNKRIDLGGIALPAGISWNDDDLSDFPRIINIVESHYRQRNLHYLVDQEFIHLYNQHGPESWKWYADSHQNTEDIRLASITFYGALQQLTKNSSIQTELRRFRKGPFGYEDGILAWESMMSKYNNQGHKEILIDQLHTKINQPYTPSVHKDLGQWINQMEKYFAKLDDLQHPSDRMSESNKKSIIIRGCLTSRDDLWLKNELQNLSLAETCMRLKHHAFDVKMLSSKSSVRRVHKMNVDDQQNKDNLRGELLPQAHLVGTLPNYAWRLLSDESKTRFLSQRNDEKQTTFGIETRIYESFTGKEKEMTILKIFQGNIL